MDDKVSKIKEWLLEQQKIGNFDEAKLTDYMMGLYNGVELALSILEDRKPILKHR